MQANMEWYKVFYWAARYGNLSRAAEELFLTQPAVSHAIRQLEQKLGESLFVRTPKGVTLTAEGAALYRYVEQACHFLEMGEKKLGEMQRLQSGEVRIGAGDTLCKHVLLPKLAAFHREYPAIKLKVMNRTSDETVALLKEGELDFGVVHLPLAEDRLLEVRESVQLHDILVGGEEYRGMSEKPLAPHEVEQLPLLLLEQGSRTRSYLDGYAQRHGVVWRPEIELGSIDLLVQFARSGLGVAFVVREFVREELKRGELIELPLVQPIEARPVGLIHLRDVPLSRAAGLLLEQLAAAGMGERAGGGAAVSPGGSSGTGKR